MITIVLGIYIINQPSDFILKQNESCAKKN